MEKEYDYIIAGAGCAGLSLLMRMNGDPFFADKKILVVDAAGKNQNDRTWCFWEKEPDIFGAIRHGALLENVPFFPGTRTVNYAVCPGP